MWAVGISGSPHCYLADWDERYSRRAVVSVPASDPFSELWSF